MKENKYKIGDEVTWQIHAGGYGLLTFAGTINGTVKDYFPNKPIKYTFENVRLIAPKPVSEPKLTLLDDRIKKAINK